MKNNQLRNKTINGMIWAFCDLLANYGTNFLIQIILARLLLPEDFGLIGMINVFISLSTTIVDSGFTNALIRENKSSQSDYSTVFYFNLIVSIFMYFILFAISGSISNFYNEPRIIPLIRVMGLTLIINSFGLVQRTMLIKKIDFKTQTRINLISVIISGVVAFIFVMLGFGVWGLVMQVLSKQFIQALLLCLLNKWYPSLIFNINSFKRLFKFGWKILVSTMINTLYNNLYYLIIGKLFSATELGYYTNSQKLMDLSSQSVTKAVQKVSYPVLSSIQEDNYALINGYKKIIKNSVFITFPMMFGLIAIANPFILLVFGEKWSFSIKYFQILCLGGMLFPLHAINLNILQVKGRSDLFLKLEIIRKIIAILLVTISMMLKLGIIGLLWVTVLNSIIEFFLNSVYSGKMLKYSTFDQIKDITPIFLSSLIMAILVFLVGNVLHISNLSTLLIQIPIGIISFLILCKVFNINELKTIYEVVKLIFRKK